MNVAQKPKILKRFSKVFILLILIIVVKIFSSFPSIVEHYYSGDLYTGISRAQRFITGWIPFSMGDLLYFLASCYLIWLIIRLFRHIRLHRTSFVKEFPFVKSIVVLCSIYLIFNVLWGVNYNRQGISKQLGLNVKSYTLADLKFIQHQLLMQTNASKLDLQSVHAQYPSSGELFRRAERCYDTAAILYPFLDYHPHALKSSLYGEVGNYLGFSGYYDPFTGEAQVNTTIPKFLLPFTTCHEMAHQLGYAKEMEANFVGYLAASATKDTLFRYSTYLDLFVYATREVAFYDSNYAKASYKQLLPGVKSDLLEVRAFWRKHQNPVEPVITWLYGNYLKANQQPRGMQSYNEVTADLIAYYNKYGKL